jgi:CRP/FNR family cyclic AMP-dependent transcriptional regulator
MATKSTCQHAHPFLAVMVPEHRSVLLEGAQELALSEGEILFREGQPANRLYLVHQGRVALETHVPGKGAFTMITIGPGQALGWSWLVAPFVWQFQARAIENVQAIVLNGGHLLVACERNQYLGYELMKNISKVILEAVLAAHQRWIEAGHRPSAMEKAVSPSSAIDVSLPLEERIAQHPFFHGMPLGYVHQLGLLAIRKQLEPGQFLFQAGDPADGLYVIDHGRLLLEATFDDEVIPVQTIGAGDAVGWSSFCEPYEWQFSCRALDPVDTLFFSAATLRERCAADYHLGYELTKRIMRMMLQRLQHTRKRMWEAFR